MRVIFKDHVCNKVTSPCKRWPYMRAKELGFCVSIIRILCESGERHREFRNFRRHLRLRSKFSIRGVSIRIWNVKRANLNVLLTKIQNQTGSTDPGWFAEIICQSKFHQILRICKSTPTLPGLKFYSFVSISSSFLNDLAVESIFQCERQNSRHGLVDLEDLIHLGYNDR